MITGAIVSAILAALDAIFSLLPSWTPNVPTQGAGFHNVILVNQVIPMYAMVQALLAYIALLLLLRVWDFAVFVFHQFWGSD